MHNNPIADQIEKMGHLWEQRVGAATRLVRWLISLRESSLYEGFCKLEASAHGNLAELFVLLYTPFADPATYSRALAGEWIQVYQHTAERAQLADHGLPEWD